MNLNNVYEIFVYIACTDINFEVIFYKLDEPQKTELLEFIKFLKTKPSVIEYKNYKVSKEVHNIYLEFIKSVIRKVK